MELYRNCKKKWMNYIIFFITILIFFFWGSPNYADNGLESATGFTYSIKFPENQINKELGYYHLKMEPGKEQKLNIDLSNPSNEKVTIDVKINGAKTNQNGVIEYGESTIENDASLKYDFSSLVKAAESVELAPGETKILEVLVSMPETQYDGVIAGGIQLMRSGQDNQNNKNSDGSKVINQYAYVVAFVLQETDNVVTPDLSLNGIKAGQDNYRNSIFVNFSNVMASYLDNMTTEVQITAKGKDTILYERKQTAMRMAPNSFVNFPVSMNGERMAAGDYVATILVTSGDRKWTWTEDFNISDKDANKFNERDVGLVQEKGVDWKSIAAIVGIILTLIIFVFILIRLKNKKKLALKRKRKKNSKMSSSNGEIRKKNY